ncbi:MAG: hypothetical protein WC334_07460 [Kiritimatiellales bacterium]|jgi:hypothetical protein
MTTQPEQILEDNLVKQLTGMGYEPAAVRDWRKKKVWSPTSLKNWSGIICLPAKSRSATMWSMQWSKSPA